MRNVSTLIATIVTLAVVVTGCTSQSSTTGPSASPGPVVVTVGQAADPPTLDPQKPGGPIGDNFNANLFDTLTAQDQTGKVVPNIATEWTQLSDTKWRFKLRQDAKFSDGEDVDANAVKFTIARVLEPGKVRNTYSFGIISSADVVEKYTVDITTKVASPFVPLQVTDLYLLPPNATAAAGEEKFATAPVGSGPFVLGDYLPNQRITLNTNKTYWKGAPKISQLVFRPIPETSTRLAELLSGGIDIMTDLTPEQAVGIKSNTAVAALALKSKRVPFVGFNLLAAGPVELKDKRVRQALNYAVDVDAIVKSVLSGYGERLATIYRSDWEGYDSSIQPYKRDVAKAKQLLADAGFPNGFTIKMQTSAAIISKGVEVSQAVVGQLADVGVKVDLTPLDLNTYRGIVIGGQKETKTAGLYLWNWGAKLGDEFSALNGFLKSTGVSSYWNNPAFDALVAQAASTTDATARTAGLKTIQAMLKDEAPVLFLYQASDIYGVSSRIDWKPRTDQYILGREMQAK